MDSIDVQELLKEYLSLEKSFIEMKDKDAKILEEYNQVLQSYVDLEDKKISAAAATEAYNLKSQSDKLSLIFMDRQTRMKEITSMITHVMRTLDVNKIYVDILEGDESDFTSKKTTVFSSEGDLLIHD